MNPGSLVRLSSVCVLLFLCSCPTAGHLWSPNYGLLKKQKKAKDPPPGASTEAMKEARQIMGVK